MAKKMVPRVKPDRVPAHRGRGENPPTNSVDPPPRDGVRMKRPDRRGKRHEPPQYAYIAFAVGSFLVVVMAALSYAWYTQLVLNVVRTPLNAPSMNNASLSLEDPSRYWGSYRSGLYFGMKTRTPHSPVVGVMWMNQFGGSESAPLPPIRHWCDQGDGLPAYGWFAHDGANFGVHEVLDQYYTVSTDFVKRPGGAHGGDWSSGMRVTPRPQAQNVTMSLFVYMALDPEGQGEISAVLAGDRVTAIRGRTPELGEFTLNFPKPDKPFKANYLVGYSPGLDLLTQSMSKAFNVYSAAGGGKSNVPEVRYIGLAGQVLPDGLPVSKANFIVAQFTVDVPFEMQIAFESGSFTSRPGPFVGETYRLAISDHLTTFDRRFEEVFGVTAKGYDRDRVTFAKAILSNMIGGIGYFHGSSLVTSAHAINPLEYWPASLYTAVPSRSFFPRGFLWDEGFHNILINEWNSEISRDIIGHWLDLLNAEGWIPREQILGAEARAKVPAEFVVQSNENANPPTLFLPLRAMVSRLSPTDARGHDYLKRLFPRLKVWYDWYNRTQSGLVGGTYRWRGRNATGVYELNPKALTSGLDDYPRASHPTDEERHVDLRCWMALASGVMADIARAVNESWEDYERTSFMLVDNERLDALHWSERTQSYADYGLHTDRVKLERPVVPVKNLQMGQRPPQHQASRQKERVVKTPPVLQLVDSEFGYVSLFPFLLRIVDADSPKLGKILGDLKNENLLWTPYGLRSLAKNSPSYGKHNTEHDPPYWRGAIWINMNYLAIGALNHYASTPGPHRETAGAVYAELRRNVVENMYQQYRLSGYCWEQYDDTTGKGKGSHPFTGWSALVVSIMSEHYY